MKTDRQMGADILGGKVPYADLRGLTDRKPYRLNPEQVMMTEKRMPSIAITDLEPGRLYWIRKPGADAEIEIGRVSTVFGKDREYWTVETIGSETHHMLYDFQFLMEIEPPQFDANAAE